MTMRDEYRTKAAEFQARAAGESDRKTRLHFESLANDYGRLRRHQRLLINHIE